jgi:hypothetical protein
MKVIVLDNIESAMELLEMIKTFESMNKGFTKCEQCNGTGEVCAKGMYDSWVCKKCNGTGKTIISIDPTPTECDSNCICPDCMSKKQVVESWNPIDSAPMNTPVFVKDADNDIGIGICKEVVRGYNALGEVRTRAWKLHFATLGDPVFWLPINWPGV